MFWQSLTLNSRLTNNKHVFIFSWLLKGFRLAEDSSVKKYKVFIYFISAEKQQDQDGDQTRAAGHHHLHPLQHHQVHLHLSSGTGVTKNTNLPQIHSLLPRCGQKSQKKEIIGLTLSRKILILDLWRLDLKFLSWRLLFSVHRLILMIFLAFHPLTTTGLAPLCILVFLNYKVHVHM